MNRIGQQQHYQQFHCNGIRNRRVGMLWMDVQCLQQGRHRRAEDMVQEFSKSKLFHI